MIEQYNIKRLFSDYTLFVPEIQRDYVWGSEYNCQKVMIPFLKSLNHNLADNRPCNIGFLYSYTHSNDDNYIIDGQQRFTTIVLLLYVLAIRENKDFDSYIGFERPTMRFGYNVRPQTETFTRKLFLSHEVQKNEILNQTWFLPEYSFDTTISSMVNAVDTLNSEIPNLRNITFEKVLNQVCFWYFNVDETSQGEELYITMNSRGQKLTESEQIKPYLFDLWQKRDYDLEDNTDYGKLWDDWEELFYSKKGKAGIISVDIAMNSFLRIIYEMERQSECRGELPARNDVLNLPLISHYMKSMRVFAKDEWPALLTEELDYRPYRLLKALIAEGLKPVHYSKDEERVERVFRNIVERRKYRINHNDILVFLHAYSRSTESFYDFIIDHPDISSKVFDEHELCKIRIYKLFDNNPLIQQAIETAFAKEENGLVWSGNISPLIKWSILEEDNISSFSFAVFENYARVFNSLFGDDMLKREDMDLTRQALLAFGLHDYPRIFKGYTNTCFAYDEKEWHQLFLDGENIQRLKIFLDQYKMHYDESKSKESSLKKFTNSYPVENDYSEFVHDGELLRFCKQKNIQWWWNTIYLIRESTAHSEHANIHSYKYYLTRKNYFDFTGWDSLKFYPRDISCVYLDYASKSIAVDAYWNGGNKHQQMAIEIHMRNKKTKEAEDFLKPILCVDGYVWNGERYVNHFDGPKNEYEAFVLMDKKITEIVDFINKNILKLC